MSMDQLKDLPNSSGVYFFHNKAGEILYIGKAVNLKRRVSSYFQKKIFEPRLSDLVSKIDRVEYIETDSVIEALILEANEIKKHQPFYNVKLKDDKTFVNIAVSREEFPRIFVIRPNVHRLYRNIPIARLFGPYTSANTARLALKILRRIFPFRSLEKTKEAERFYREIIEIPENKERYKEVVRNAILFLEGKKKRLIVHLEKRMEEMAKMQRYEDATMLRNQIFALQHIQDVALIREEAAGESENGNVPERIEAYDISNIFGRQAVGSMVVFTNGRIDKNEYRRFKIRSVSGVSDVAMLEEVLVRRFRHREWKFPDLVVIDGGLGQFNVAQKVLKFYNLNVPVISIAKGADRKGEKLFVSNNASALDKKYIVALRDESHRFAISYHRKLKRKNLFE